MMEPKFLPFLTDHTKKTEHGYEYIELSKDTPQELMNIWILSWNRTSTVKIMNALLHYSGRIVVSA